MNELQIEVVTVRDDVQSGKMTLDNARIWAVEFARLIGKDDTLAALNLMIIATCADDESFRRFIDGLTAAMLEKKPRGHRV